MRTWASGASHWLGDEWVHAPGYGGETGDPLSVWGAAMKAAGGGVRFQTKQAFSDERKAVILEASKALNRYHRKFMEKKYPNQTESNLLQYLLHTLNS